MLTDYPKEVSLFLPNATEPFFRGPLAYDDETDKVRATNLLRAEGDVRDLPIKLASGVKAAEMTAVFATGEVELILKADAEDSARLTVFFTLPPSEGEPERVIATYTFED